MFGDVCDLGAIQIAAFKIHASVGASGVLAQNAIKQNQGFQNILPGGLADIAQASHTYAGPIGAADVGGHLRSAGRDLFQQDQLQRWNQRPQLDHLQHRVLLKSLHISDQRALAEIVAAGRQKSRSQRHHPRSHGAIGSADVGKLAHQLEAFLRTPEVSMQQAKVVVQPAKIVSDRGLGGGPVKIPQDRPDRATQDAVALGEMAGRVRARQPYQSPAQVRGSQTEGLRVGPSLFGWLRQPLCLGIQHLDMGIWRHGL